MLILGNQASNKGFCEVRHIAICLSLFPSIASMCAVLSLKVVSLAMLYLPLSRIETYAVPCLEL